MEAWLELFEFYILGVILLIVAVCGVIGNALFIIMFSINYIGKHNSYVHTCH